MHFRAEFVYFLNSIEHQQSFEKPPEYLFHWREVLQPKIDQVGALRHQHLFQADSYKNQGLINVRLGRSKFRIGAQLNGAGLYHAFEGHAC